MQLNYKKLGEGQPLIILHGLFGSLDNWMTHAKKWSESYQVWMIDQRNHGQSPHSDEFDYNLMAEDLKNFIEEHDIQKPVILGHSMGGKTAMEFAVNYPDNVRKLIIVDIAPVSYQVHHYGIIEALESVDLNKVKSRKDAEEQLKGKIKEFGIRQFLLKNLYRKNKDEYAWRFNLPVIKKQIELISKWSISNKSYEGETLFISGGNSDYILPEYGVEIAAKFPNYELEEIADAGHWVHAEAPEKFSKVVEKFINK